ncbi:type I pullulanase [Virgibacillus ainsalahensis]
METRVAWIDDIHKLTVISNDIDELIQDENPPVIYWEDKEKYFQTKMEEKIEHSIVHVSFFEDLPMGENLVLLWGGIEIPVYPGAIVRTDWFDYHYGAPDAELGAIYENSATTFAVWAPTAISVKLSLGEQQLLLSKPENGVWKLKVNGDWHGFAYDFEITVNGKKTRCNDPYAKALLANSEKSVVIDLSRTVQEDNRPRFDNLQDAIIYELHVRDATVHDGSGIKNKGKFLGLTEKDTSNSNGSSTGFSYIKELGCTHVQLLPVNDFARVDELNPDKEYNWGYDPLYFQVPEGGYSTSPDDPLVRINECKKMIQSFHQEGLSIILDVVYNHVFIMENSSFEKLVPGYYFRYHADGTLSNGTGVGNDFASERKMAQKFILDTIDFWLKEYHVDGFRFDLMGAMDIETMQKIQQRCGEEKIPIMLLGEGWDLPTALESSKKATSANSRELVSTRFFNDYFRDSLKGNLFDATDSGFVNGNGHFIERMPNLVTGSALDEFGESVVADVDQTINYVECHDNHTLWDRLLLTNPEEIEMNRKKIHQLATGITLLSQGVPFLHAGQEWFRTKQGDENSYNSGDGINQLDWNRREQEDETIQLIKNLISIRKKYDVFRMTSKREIRRRFHLLETPHPLFGFTLLGDNEDFAIYANPTKDEHELHLPSSGNWKIAATNAFDQKQEQSEINGEFTFILPYELIVLKKLLNGKH